MPRRPLLPGLLLLPLAGCTVLSGGLHQELQLVGHNVQNPICEVKQGEEVVATLETIPSVVRVRRSAEPVQIACRKAGFKDQVIKLEPATHAKVWENVAMGGGVSLLFLAVDVHLNAHWRYPDQVDLFMMPKGLTDEETAEWKRKVEVKRALLRCDREGCTPEELEKIAAMSEQPVSGAPPAGSATPTSGGANEPSSPPPPAASPPLSGGTSPMPAPSGTQLPGQGGVLIPGQNGTQIPGPGGVMIPGQNGTQIPGQGGVMVPGQNGTRIPGQGGVMIPGQNGTQIPGPGGVMIPG
ncbi:MAG: hypothetical protein HQL51_05765, partial [Magnetococcales bacterium]|nr:hypothetical protein [Magnetococcales bacterium]